MKAIPHHHSTPLSSLDKNLNVSPNWIDKLFKHIKYILILILLLCSTYSRVHAKNTNPNLVGEWHLEVNADHVSSDYNDLSNQSIKGYAKEKFNFNADHTFSHSFFDDSDALIRVWYGIWKSSSRKGLLWLQYNDVDYAVNTNFFFIDNHLVLGQKHNQVILHNDALEQFTTK